MQAMGWGPDNWEWHFRVAHMTPSELKEYEEDYEDICKALDAVGEEMGVSRFEGHCWMEYGYW